ncbi:MAG TPA: phosphoglucosamine mutase, partial [Micromonosporaceae bacterium]|nr:phosphoglucosamine mutase [Micromonosporaceae bacterium]
MARLFGTDGVRGVANGDLGPELAMSVAMAAARVFRQVESGSRPVAVVGRDPRASGEMLEAAVVAGLASAGVDVVRVGVLPTPAVAFLTADLGANFGVMLSASHNPMPDNGIKLFAEGGHKLPDEVEDRIEALITSPGEWTRPTGPDIGRVRRNKDGVERYVRHLVDAAPNSLAGLHVVVDCANGAASTAAPDAYARAGARVTVINAQPDGYNINENSGSTHIEALQAAVVEAGADLGIAHDGDADRCLAVDATGAVVDGDQIMAILAVAMREAGTLTGDTLVGTVLSNVGLRLAMKREGITLLETAVGDRYVLETLRAHGFALGGEQSGHVILPAYATTGDGLLTAIHLMARMAATGRTLADLASILHKVPQVMVNVRVRDKASACADPQVLAAVAEAERALGE